LIVSCYCRDKTIFRLLSRATASNDDIVNLCAARDDLKQRLDSKSALGQYVGSMFDFAASMFTNADMIRIFVLFLQKSVSRDDGSHLFAHEERDTIELALSYLFMFSKHIGMVSVQSRVLHWKAYMFIYHHLLCQAFQGCAFDIKGLIDTCGSSIAESAVAVVPVAKSSKRSNAVVTNSGRGLPVVATSVLQSLCRTLSYVAFAIGGAPASTSSTEPRDELAVEEQRQDCSLLCQSLLEWATKLENDDLCENLAQAALKLALFDFQAPTRKSSTKKSRNAAAATAAAAGKRKRGKSGISSEKETDADDEDELAGMDTEELDSEEDEYALSAVKSTLQSLSQRSTLSLTNHRLASDLSVLVALVR
jgi:hypothetical protein